MLRQLGPQGGLDHPARELGQQPARAGDLLRLETLERVLERSRGQQLGQTIGLPPGSTSPIGFFLWLVKGCPLPAHPPIARRVALRAPRLPTGVSDRSIDHPDLTQNIAQTPIVKASTQPIPGTVNSSGT
jgi:hypothetical protein